MASCCEGNRLQLQTLVRRARLYFIEEPLSEGFVAEQFCCRQYVGSVTDQAK